MTNYELNTAENKVNLLHIGRFSDREVEVFTPRIPQLRAGSENANINRICAAPTLEGCIKAHPTILYYLAEYLDAEYASPYDYMGQLHMLLEHGQAGMFFRVYHFEVDETEVIKADTLQEFGYVPDAATTGEHWLLEEARPSAVSYLLVKSAEKDAETNEWQLDYQTFETLDEVGVYMDYVPFHTEIYDRQNPNEWMHKVFTETEARTFIAEAEARYARTPEEEEAERKHMEQLRDFELPDISVEDLPF